jgi:hypothetical protein
MLFPSGELRRCAEMMIENDMNSPPNGIHLIRRVFWLLLIVGIITLLAKLVSFPIVQKYTVAVLAFNSLMYATIIYGIDKKKIWLVPFLLFYAYLSLLGEIITVVFTEATDIDMLVQKLFHMILAVFFIYLVIVFSRRETKTYYSEKGQTII